jgi:hypothetical protein
LERLPTTIRLLGTILIALGATGCRPSGQPGGEVVPGLRLERVTFRVYRGTALRASGQADRVDYRRDADEVLARELTAVLPTASGDVHGTAARGSGRVRGRVFATEGGTAVERRGVVARTDRGQYQGGPPEVVHGDDPVHVEAETWSLDGRGFELDPATGDLRLGTAGGGTRFSARTVEARR